MKKIFLALLTISFLTLGFSSALAQKFGNRNSSGKERIINLLKLTDNQLTKFHKIRLEHQEAAIDMRAKLQKNRLNIEKYMLENNINKTEIIELTDKQSAIYSSMKNARINMWFDVYNILDDNQKVIWKKHFVRMGMKQKGMGVPMKWKNFNKGFNRFN